MSSKPTVLPKPTTTKLNSTDSTTKPKPTILPKPTTTQSTSTASTNKPTTQQNCTGSTTKPTTQPNSTGSTTKPFLPSDSKLVLLNLNLLTKTTDYSKLVGDASIETTEIPPAIAEINREILLKFRTLQQKEDQINDPITQRNSAGSTTKPTNQPNSTGSTKTPTTQLHSTGSTTTPNTQQNSTGSTTTPTTQLQSTGSTTTTSSQENSNGCTTTPTTQPTSTGSTTKPVLRSNSTVAQMKQVLLTNSNLHTKSTDYCKLVGEAFIEMPVIHPAINEINRELLLKIQALQQKEDQMHQPTMQPNSTGATTTPTIQSHSTGSANKPTTQANSTGSTTTMTIQIHSTGSTTIPALISNSCVSQVKLPLSINPDFPTSTSSEKVSSDVFIELPIVHSAIAGLNPEFLWKIKALQSKEVQIHIEVDQSMVTLRGNRKVIYEVKQHILELLAEDSLVQKDINHIKSTKGIKDYLLLLSQRDLDLPCYWKNSTSPTLSTSKCSYCPLVKGLPAHEAVAALILNTWNSSLVGAGRKTKRLGHSKLDIKAVWIIKNPHLYTNYQFKLKAMAVKAAHKPVSIVSDLPGEPNVMTRKIAGADYLNSRLISELNEVYLFHGTPCAHEIAENGIDCRLAGDLTLFGRGAYFAESSTKSDQYADRRRVRKDERLFMFVARVLLGEPFIAREVRPDLKKAPCSKRDFRKDDFSADHPLYDSVIGTHIDSNTPLLFREFIVYHPDQCYPEFLVEYARE